MIRFWIVAFNPLFTWDNTSSITKEPGIEVTLDYRESFFGEADKSILFSRVEIVDPLIKQLNIDKLVAPGCSRGLRRLL